jgi:LacI family transcriptional regulator
VQEEVVMLAAIKRITLKDVSELSGYSLRTVKKVMGSTEYVSEDVRQAVLAAAKKLNYKRNQFASALAKNMTYKIALVYAESSIYYFPEIEDGFTRCIDEYRDYGIAVEYFKCVTGEYDWQRGVLNEIAARNDIDAVLIQPMSASGMNKEINALVDGGKPVITFGSDAPESSRICYIGPQAFKSGRIAAQIMANYIGKKGNVYIINQLAEHMQTMERSSGFAACTEEKYPDIHVYKVNIPVNPQMYYDIVKSIVLNEHVDGIFCTDADGYLAGRVLADLGRHDITLVGYDLPNETCRLMKEGFIKVMLYQNPQMQGYQSLKIMCDYLRDRSSLVADHIYTDVTIMTSECLD